MFRLEHFDLSVGGLIGLNSELVVPPTSHASFLFAGNDSQARYLLEFVESSRQAITKPSYFAGNEVIQPKRVLDAIINLRAISTEDIIAE